MISTFHQKQSRMSTFLDFFPPRSRRAFHRAGPHFTLYPTLKAGRRSRHSTSHRGMFTIFHLESPPPPPLRGPRFPRVVSDHVLMLAGVELDGTARIEVVEGALSPRSQKVTGHYKAPRLQICSEKLAKKRKKKKRRKEETNKKVKVSQLDMEANPLSSKPRRAEEYHPAGPARPTPRRFSSRRSGTPLDQLVCLL